MFSGNARPPAQQVDVAAGRCSGASCSPRCDAGARVSNHRHAIRGKRDSTATPRQSRSLECSATAPSRQQEAQAKAAAAAVAQAFLPEGAVSAEVFHPGVPAADVEDFLPELGEDEEVLFEDDVDTDAAADWETEWVDPGMDMGDWDDEDDEAKPINKRLPAEMRCFDTARIFVQAGDGGRGCVAFRREKYVPKGGPSGGNGGHGGNVWAVADVGLNSLSTFRRQVHFRARLGTPGGGSKMAGAAGGDTYVRVPPGTVIRQQGAAPDQPPLAELLAAGSKALLATGGRGGRGNASFKTSRNNAPALAEKGEAAEGEWLDLELKLVADVGIVGVPNAGKSTLLSVASRARPKIADYPFTTLVPNLGVVEMDFRSSVWCDIPGLLEGAHEGTGLGHEFLRHCQRCRLLVHVVDGSSRDPCGDFAAIQQELALFSPGLAAKRQVVVYNKMDLPDSADYEDIVREFLLEQGVAEGDIYAISAATGQGLQPLVRAVQTALDQLPSVAPEEVQTWSHDAWVQLGPAAINRQVPERAVDERQLDDFTVEADLAGPRVFTVQGAALNRFVQMTNWDYYEAARRFQKILDAAGVVKALQRQGVMDGDTVVIGDMELQWSSDRTEGALFDQWQADRKAAGRVAQGTARWPHPGG